MLFFKPLYGFQQAFTMYDRQDVDFLAFKFINKTITVDETLSYLGILQLRNNASHAGLL